MVPGMCCVGTRKGGVGGEVPGCGCAKVCRAACVSSHGDLGKPDMWKCGLGTPHLCGASDEKIPRTGVCWAAETKHREFCKI